MPQPANTNGLESSKIDSLQKQIQHLREKLNDYKQIFDNINEAFFRTTLDGKLLFANKGLLDISGFKTIDQLFSQIQDTRKYYRDPQKAKTFRNLLLENGKVEEFEAQMITKDGKNLWCSTNARLICDQNNNPKYIEGTIRDITKRKNAEKKLKETNKMFQSIYNHTNVCFWITEVRENGQFRWVHNNPADQELTGLNLNNPQGIPFEQIRDPEDARNDYNKCRKALETKKPVNFVDSFIKNGKKRWSLNTLIPVEDENQKVNLIIGSGIDITDIKKSQQALQISEKRYKLAKKSGQVGFWEWDIKNNKFYIDPYLKTMIGFQDHEIKNDLEDWSSYIYPEDRPLVEKRTKECIEGKNEIYEVTHRMMHKNGTLRWFLARGFVEKDENQNIIRLSGTDTDITERIKIEEQLKDARNKLEQRVKQRTAELAKANAELQNEIHERKKIEHQLRESRARYKSQFESIHTVSLIIEPETGNIIDANPAACSFYGYPRNKLTEMNIKHINILSDQQIQKEMELAKSGRKKHFHFKHKLANGNIRDVEVYSGQVKIQNKKYLYSIIHDITERINAQQKAKQHQQQLIHASRLISIGELTSGLAHEINQPLCGALVHTEGCLKMIKTGNINLDKIQNKMETAVKQAQRAGEIINRIKLFVKKDIIKKSPLKAETVIMDSIEFMDYRIRQNNVNIIYKPGCNPTIYADKVQIEQVMINLLNNACEALTETDIDDRNIYIKCFSNGKNASFSVEDTGKNFNNKQISNILEPFVTTKPNGLGLGLSISRSIVQSHGGKLTVSANKKRGLTFEFTVPIYDENVN
jgi:PAS domain S-box-containing protein